MPSKTRATTLGGLKKSGYAVLPVRHEMRKNLVEKIRKDQVLFPTIIGFGETVIPQIENALLAGQDMIFLGERGQAKSRLIRSLVNLLDEEVPIVSGCEISDNPYAPACRACKEKVAQEGDATAIEWINRDRRYGEKLATPDITIADIIGEVDPIKVAEGRYLADEFTIHYGLIPRTNRGIFCINELPDLPERVQVGLFNLLEERDIQIKGYKIRLPLDIFVVASANPEDYTNRGRIITPLKDRYGAMARTHYPKSMEHELEIMEQEAQQPDIPGTKLSVPYYMKEVIAEFTVLARRSPDINQRSGVSVRVSIDNYESIMSNALRRALRLGEEHAVPRISDLPYILASTSGKLELESVEEGRETRLIEELTKKALLTVFGRYFSVHDFDEQVLKFEEGAVVETSDMMPVREYVRKARQLGGFGEELKRLGVDENPAAIASAVEFILEGLHLNRRLNRDKVEGRYRYRS